MAEWEFDEAFIDSIGDMTWAGSLTRPVGYGRIKASVHLTDGPSGSLMNINVELPLIYRGGDTIAAVQQRAYEELIAGLLVAVTRLADLPPPTVD